MKISSENPNQSAITTNYVMEQNHDITYVSYDEEGDWQFMSDDPFDEENAMVVSIKQILEKDKTLLTLPNIRKNEAYERKNKKSPWVKSTD